MMLALLSAMLSHPITKRFVFSSFITSLLSTIKLVSKRVCGESSEACTLPIILLASCTGRRPVLPWGVTVRPPIFPMEPFFSFSLSLRPQKKPEPSFLPKAKKLVQGFFCCRDFAKMKKRARGFHAQKGAIFLFRNSASFYQIRILLTTLDSGERAKVPFFLGSPLWWLKKKNFIFFEFILIIGSWGVLGTIRKNSKNFKKYLN